MTTAIFSDLLTRIRDENLEVYRVSPQRLREDVGQEAQIAQDYRGRLIYELLQNADDAISSDSNLNTSNIAFVLDDDALWVANSGRPLDEADVRGLCGISASSKTAKPGKRRASIGHKGMGFKSVLEVSDAPEVYSTTICFRFGPEAALQAVRTLIDEKKISPSITRAPITRFPWPIEMPSNLWQQLRARGMQTAFRFPFNDKMTEEQREGLAQALRDLPVTSLVFLKRLNRVEVSIRSRSTDHSFAWTTKRERLIGGKASKVPTFLDSGMYRVVLCPDQGEPETFLVAHDPGIEIESHRGALDEFAWEGVELTEVSVAARMRNGKPVKLKPVWQKLHVFLPTGEPCPYSLLVNGAFSSNLSRQEIRVEDDVSNYNRFLFRNAGRLLRDVLIPQLLACGATASDVLLLLDRKQIIAAGRTAGAANVLFDEVRAALRNFPFIPQENGEPLSIAACVVPPLVENAQVGREFRQLLPIGASFRTQFFPSIQLCGSDVARILVDHGAIELDVADAANVLAHPDPSRSQIEVSGKLFVDPVLRVLEQLYLALKVGKREALVEAARCEPLFPVGIAPDGTSQRVCTKGITCFYPPRSLRGTVPLDGLSFLMQEICWGDLTPKERNQVLKQELSTWQAIFDLQEFKFPAVMRASVLPTLDLDRDADNRGMRNSLHSLECIAAICQLAGRTPTASAPLPYERLGTSRALFNLSRLDVPCRGTSPGEILWVPAYRAYLGADWVGNNSVECILDAARAASVEELPKINFLVGPDAFATLLSKYGHLREAPPHEESDLGTDEVSIDEDEEASLEDDDRARWLAFFQWLGVNQALRPVHFHDVEDRASGWLSTANLKRPEGWIFSHVDRNLWDRYVKRLRQSLAESPTHDDSTPYFYRLHDLEHLVTLLQAACVNNTAELGTALYEHLARNWPTLERFSRAIIAQIPLGSMPSKRTKPAQAKAEELIDAGPDFWVTRLLEAPFCPTSHGPRHAEQIWLPTLEVERRFGRRGKTDSFLVPVLKVAHDATKGKAKGLAHALGIREELSPATFTLGDARVLLERLRDVYAGRIEAREDLRQELREVIRPAYRNLFELLSAHSQALGKVPVGESLLANVPLLAQDGRQEFRFFEDRQLYYMDRRDTRERLHTDSTIWTFVLEAFPGARAPMVHLFGVPVLEETLRWAPTPGDAAFGTMELAVLRQELEGLAPYVLARIAADRTDEKLARFDAQRLRQFVECIEPVRHLELACELNGERLSLGNIDRDAFVALESDKPYQVFVVWGEQPWPPEPREAEALANALCDVFGAGYFEPFFALVQAKSPKDRERLLRRTGAPMEIDERRVLFFGGDPGEETGETVLRSRDEPMTTVVTGTKEQPAVFPSNGVERRPPTDVRRTPLYSPDQLRIDGDPIVVLGVNPPSTTASKPSPGVQPSKNGDGTVGFGGHTDLVALDKIGMWVASSFEKNRLRRCGLSNVEIFNPAGGANQPEALIFDVSAPEKIAHARVCSPRFNAAMLVLNHRFGLSLEWPGFDLLTLDPTAPDGLGRLIELKSSGVASRVQEMSWNEWKVASSSSLGARFYLYLVGNLRSDLDGAAPFVRTIQNPFDQLTADVRVGRALSRKVQLAVHLFREAEHLSLSVDVSPSPPIQENAA